MQLQPAGGETIRKDALKGRTRRWHASHFAVSNRRGDVAAGSEINLNRLAGTPIRGDLQDGGPAQAAMRDEHIFAEGGPGQRSTLGGCDYLGGIACELAIFGALLRGKDQRNQSRPWFDDRNVELASHVVAQSRGPHFWNR